MDFSIVTVAHSLDFPLLMLQARSLDRYLARDFVREIIVVDNSVDSPLDRAVLLPQYGDLPVRIIDATTLAPRPNAGGWLTQQGYKLLMARDVCTKNYLVLDAKNHLIAPLTLPMLQAPDGRLHIARYDYGNHPMKPYLLRACDYFGIDHVVHGFLPLGTPFAMPTDLVRNLLIHVERNDQPFMQSFVALRTTEFSLFGAYLLHLGHHFEDHYQWNPSIGNVLWFGQDNARMQQTISEASQDCFDFGVHRQTFQNMDTTTQHMVASLWSERNLFASYDDALCFIRDCTITYEAWVKQWSRP